MQEQEIKFRSNGMDIAGTLTLPASYGSFPAVLLVTGSGQVDRNENHKKMKLNAFYEISHFLAQNGIASLKYDKRGVGESEGNYWGTGFYDHVQDTLAALKYLQEHKNIQSEKVFILGHSEGAFIATRLAGIGTQMAGIILLSGAAQSGEDVLKWQAGEIVKGIKGFNGWLINKLHIDVQKKQQKSIDEIKKSKKDWYRKALIAKINAKWLREFMAYNPVVDMLKITIPVLAITGSKDIQVNPADLEEMAKIVKSSFESHIIENMTHILRIEDGEASISKYKEELKKPIVPELLELILQWLEKRINLKNDSQA